MAINAHRREQLNRASRARYRIKRQRGQCVIDGCYVRVPKGITCPLHKARLKRYNKKCSSRQQARLSKNKGQRELYALRKRLGVCVDCGCDDLATPTRCQAHRERFNNRFPRKTTKRCSVCRELGHEIRTCPLRFKRDVNVIEYATARKGE
jgi:hypothetical protein